MRYAARIELRAADFQLDIYSELQGKPLLKWLFYGQDTTIKIYKWLQILSKFV